MQIDLLQIDFDKESGLVPAIVQDHQTREVLMLGYMNQEAVVRTLKSNRVTFYSRSRKEIWIKGETSGNTLELISMYMDCDQDALLVLARPKGPTCHTGEYSCFGVEPDARTFLGRLEEVILDRQENPKPGSYTTKLFEKGIQKIAQKVGEEAVELILESETGSDERLLNEGADLFYHLMVLLRARELSLSDLVKVLEERH
jgi:phosphoribosyl-ATP pyrophosphohydrolase/phosphoribosyl-AMP cyclohydrolase